MYKLTSLFLMTFSASLMANMNFSKDFSLKEIEVDSFSSELSSFVFSNTTWPELFAFQKRSYVIDYTVDAGLEKYIKKELRRYSSDYASVVVIDNNTGKILSAGDYTRSIKSYGKNLTFSATNPAASIFKVITSADLIENHEIKEDAAFTYNGRATTLYKYQLKNKKNKWTRKTTLKRAFARSNNVVFAKAASAHSSFESLTKTAQKFGFNKDLLQFLDMGQSRLFTENTSYGLAEMASGFNSDTMMSPVHGAIIASIMANDGVLKTPYIINSIREGDKERYTWKAEKDLKRIISKEAADKMRNLMELTVSKGTARSAFRRAKKRKLKNFIIGGKTGSLTGGVPYGKRDWFVSYAMPKDGTDKGISVCVMNVNLKKWYIKSSALAKNIIEYYYSRKPVIN